MATVFVCFYIDADYKLLSDESVAIEKNIYGSFHSKILNEVVPSGDIWTQKFSV